MSGDLASAGAGIDELRGARPARGRFAVHDEANWREDIEAMARTVSCDTMTRIAERVRGV